MSKSGFTRAGFDVRIRKFETGSLSNWLWHQLRALGFPVICFVRVMPTRSDENDAKGLAEMARMGWYPQAAVKCAENWKTRSMLAARTKLMNLRRDIDNQMRGLCKRPGIVLGNGGPARSSARIGR